MAQTTQTEIAAARDEIRHLDRCWPREADHDALTRAAWARLRSAEEQDAEAMVTLRAWHVRMLAEYDAAGNYYAGAEHRSGIARCDAALARFAPVQRVAA